VLLQAATTKISTVSRSFLFRENNYQLTKTAPPALDVVQYATHFKFSAIFLAFYILRTLRFHLVTLNLQVTALFNLHHYFQQQTAW